MENKTFEQALTNLEQIVKELESGNVDLDNAIKNIVKQWNLQNFAQIKLKMLPLQLIKF